MKLQLYKNGNPIMGSDGILTVDGRSNTYTWRINIRQRNKSYEKNFPHLIADGFRVLNKNFVPVGLLMYVNPKPKTQNI